MFSHRLDHDRVLRLVAAEDVDELYELTASNREMLARWLPWAATATPDDTREFVTRSLRQYAVDEGLQAVIVERGAIVGATGLNELSRVNRSTELGYWLSRSAQRRGTMTLAVRALVDHAFGPLGLNRVVIRAGVDNLPSRAVAERLGFVLEGVAREAERFPDGRYVDHAVYAMLAADWPVAG